MEYYKIIQNNTVIGIGTRFLRWFSHAMAYYCCPLKDAECVMDDVSDQIYRPTWMHEPPMEAYALPEVTIEEIDYATYDELYNQLWDGETIPAPEDETVGPEPDQEQQDETEHKMTVQEMRERISELTELVMNESKPFVAAKDIGKGEVVANGSRVYIADQVIIAGEMVKPGINCTETTIAAVLNLIQASK